MNDPWNFMLAIVTIAALVVAVIDAVGVDHHQKRLWIRRLAIYLLFFFLVFTSGLLTARLYHQRNPPAEERAANEAEHAKGDNAQATHAKTSLTLEGRVTPLDTPPDHAPADPKTHKHPTPQFIYKVLEETAPVSQQKVREQFVGVPISWDGRLVSSSQGANAIRINLRPDGPSEAYGFSVPIELPKHNFLLQAKVGTHLHIEATIETVSEKFYFLRLKDPTVIELKSD